MVEDTILISQEDSTQIPWTVSFQAKKHLLEVYLSGLREGDRHIKIPLLKFVPSEPEIILKDIVWRSGGEFPTPERCWIVRFNCNGAVLLIIYTKNDL